jgi:hypothetical protein
VLAGGVEARALSCELLERHVHEFRRGEPAIPARALGRRA